VRAVWRRPHRGGCSRAAQVVRVSMVAADGVSPLPDAHDWRDRLPLLEPPVADASIASATTAAAAAARAAAGCAPPHAALASSVQVNDRSSCAN
jgi:hypothetical protein